MIKNDKKSMDFNRESLKKSIKDEKTRLAVHIHHHNLMLDMNRDSRFSHFSLILYYYVWPLARPKIGIPGSWEGLEAELSSRDQIGC